TCAEVVVGVWGCFQVPSVASLVSGNIGQVLIVDGDVEIGGGVVFANVRLTIIAHNNTQGASGRVSGNIYIMRDVKHAINNSSLGLFVGGDFIIALANNCPVRNIDGAMIASSGSPTFSPEIRFPFRPTGL